MVGLKFGERRVVSYEIEGRSWEEKVRKVGRFQAGKSFVYLLSRIRTCWGGRGPTG
jgi:hypothetical protein